MTYNEWIDQWNDDSQTVEVHTSGSTGIPKKMLVEKTKMRNSALMTCRFLGLEPGDTALLCMSVDYIGGKMMVVRSVVGGLRLIRVEPSGHPLATVDEPVTLAAMVPLQVFNSLQVPQEREKLCNIKHLIIGGGAIDEALAAQLRTFPNAVWSSYGMTETLSHIALRRLSGPEATDLYTPLDGIDITTDENHCLVVHAPHLCNEPVCTNDIAELIPSCAPTAVGKVSFRIIGRRDNVVNTGGVKVQMEELEQLLRPFLTMPYMVTKRKDKKFGEIVVLMVEKETPDEPLKGVNRSELPILKTIQKICHRALPPYQEPRLYLSVDKLPMTQTAKPDRARAMQMAEALHLSDDCIYALDQA